MTIKMKYENLTKKKNSKGWFNIELAKIWNLELKFELSGHTDIFLGSVTLLLRTV